jgi:hypothetical protein
VSSSTTQSALPAIWEWPASKRTFLPVWARRGDEARRATAITTTERARALAPARFDKVVLLPVIGSRVT